MNISYNEIYKRKLVLESASNEDKMIDENCKLDLHQFKRNQSMDRLEKFFNECAKSTMTVNKYSEELFLYAEKFTENKNLKKILIENVAPKMTVYHNIPDYLEEQIKINKLCDRILDNHKKISESTDIKEFFDKNENGILLLTKICESVAKFKLPSYGKVSVAIEESILLCGMHNIDIDSEYIAESIVDYFSIREGVDINKLNDAASKDNNILSDYSNTFNKSLTPIDLFRMGPVKDYSILSSTVDSTLSGSNINHFIIGLPEVLKLLREILASSQDESLCESIYGLILSEIYDIFYKNFAENSDARDGLKYTIEIINNAIEICKDFVYSYNNENISKRFTYYSMGLKDILAKFIELESVIYPKYNREIMEGVTVSTIYADPNKNPGYWLLPKTAKAMGILNDEKVDTKEVEKSKEKISTLAKKAAEIIEKVKDNKKDSKLSKLKNLKDKLFGESSIYDFIEIDTNRIGTSIAFYEVDGGMTGQLHDELNDLVRTINETGLFDSGYKSYYVDMDYYVEFRLCTEKYVNLSESENDEIKHYVSPITRYFMESLFELTECNLSPINPNDLTELILSEAYSVNDILEMASFAKIDKESIAMIETSELSPYERNAIERYQISTEVSDINSIIVWNFINEQIESVKNQDKKETTFKGIDFEKVKLYMQGIKSKVKELSSKEQKIMRDLDSAVSHFCDSVKRAMTADSREQIIKGSVIPSFSKCIKLGIVAAGSFGIASIFGVSFAPLVPVIIIFGAFAASKALMKEEKVALADELEIELEILDREISNAESENGNPKKLRALMSTRKQLQRQYQRLKLGNAGGKRLANKLKPSTVGIPKK